jgi:hypothetical protein
VLGRAFQGSLGGTHLNKPITGIAATPNGQGYCLFYVTICDKTATVPGLRPMDDESLSTHGNTGARKGPEGHTLVRNSPGLAAGLPGARCPSTGAALRAQRACGLNRGELRTAVELYQVAVEQPA